MEPTVQSKCMLALLLFPHQKMLKGHYVEMPGGGVQSITLVVDVLL